MAAPLVLGKEDTAELCKGVGPDVVEHPEESLTVLDGERDDSRLEGERLLEKGARRLIDEPYELANVVVRNVQAREIHRSYSLRGDE